MRGVTSEGFGAVGFLILSTLQAIPLHCTLDSTNVGVMEQLTTVMLV